MRPMYNCRSGTMNIISAQTHTIHSQYRPSFNVRESQHFKASILGRFNVRESAGLIPFNRLSRMVSTPPYQCSNSHTGYIMLHAPWPEHLSVKQAISTIYFMSHPARLCSSIISRFVCSSKSFNSWIGTSTPFHV